MVLACYRQVLGSIHQIHCRRNSTFAGDMTLFLRLSLAKLVSIKETKVEIGWRRRVIDFWEQMAEKAVDFLV